MRHSPQPETDSSDSGEASPLANASRRPSVVENGDLSDNTNHNSNGEMAAVETKSEEDNSAKYYATRSSAAKQKRLSVKTVELAIDCCQKYINDLEHGDLDINDQVIYLLDRLLYG